MSFLGRLFAGPEALGKSLDAVIKTGDALVFTQEEKAERNEKTLEWYFKFMQATSPSHIARRVLAFLVAGSFIIMLFLGVALQLAGLDERAEFVFRTLEVVLYAPFNVVMSFYFLVTITDNFIKPKV